MIYTYSCECGEEVEIARGVFDDYEVICKCGREMSRLFTANHLIFKGEGFYVNDYRGRE